MDDTDLGWWTVCVTWRGSHRQTADHEKQPTTSNVIKITCNDWLEACVIQTFIVASNMCLLSMSSTKLMRLTCWRSGRGNFEIWLKQHQQADQVAKDAQGRNELQLNRIRAWEKKPDLNFVKLICLMLLSINTQSLKNYFKLKHTTITILTII